MDFQMIEWVERGRKTEKLEITAEEKKMWPILGELDHFWPFCLELKSSDQGQRCREVSIEIVVVKRKHRAVPVMMETTC